MPRGNGGQLGVGNNNQLNKTLAQGRKAAGLNVWRFLQSEDLSLDSITAATFSMSQSVAIPSGAITNSGYEIRIEFSGACNDQRVSGEDESHAHFWSTIVDLNAATTVHRFNGGMGIVQYTAPQGSGTGNKYPPTPVVPAITGTTRLSTGSFTTVTSTTTFTSGTSVAVTFAGSGGEGWETPFSRMSVWTNAPA